MHGCMVCFLSIVFFNFFSFYEIKNVSGLPLCGRLWSGCGVVVALLQDGCRMVAMVVSPWQAHAQRNRPNSSLLCFFSALRDPLGRAQRASVGRRSKFLRTDFVFSCKYLSFFVRTF